MMLPLQLCLLLLAVAPAAAHEAMVLANHHTALAVALAAEEELWAPLRDGPRLFALPGLVLALLVGTRVVREVLLRDWKRPGTVVVQYEPPAGLTPAEAGTLLDHWAEAHDLTATLVDLAVHGHILIEEVKEKQFFGLFTTTDYIFHLRTPRSAWQVLAPHEQLYLDGLFRARLPATLRQGYQAWTRHLEAAQSVAEAGRRPFDKQQAVRDFSSPVGDRESVRLSVIQHQFARQDTWKITAAIYKQLAARGLYHAKRSWLSRTFESLLLSLPMLGFLAGVGYLFVALGQGVLILHPMVLFATFGLGMLTLILFGPLLTGRRAPAGRTREGVRALEGVLGFKEFLARVESDRYRRMITSPAMFEEYLPYAMAFRVEKRWAKAFDDLYTTPPDWYRSTGNGRFRASLFAHSLSRFSRQASSAMTRTSSAGGRSGSGGGGRSGGGSGGGGGRGF
jgi:uncharacterized membrane protein YgcG